MMRRIWLRDLLAIVVAVLMQQSVAVAQEGGSAAIPGLELTRGDTFEIKGAFKPVAFRFNDGRICVAAKDGNAIWSEDAGKTWHEGPPGPLDKTALDFGDGEVISISRDLIPRADGKLTVSHRRSTDKWKTVRQVDGVADVPLATSAGGDTRDTVPSMLMHHGIVQLKNGELLATLYGNYKGDRIPFDAYPPELRAYKYRTVIVRSFDRGMSWGDRLTAARHGRRPWGSPTAAPARAF
jgi:hypothetical protein